MNCLKCGSPSVQKRGFNVSQEGKFQRYQCTQCSAWFSETEPQETIEEFSQARVAILDVETLPSKGYMWGFWEQNFSQSQVIQEGCLLSWGIKLLNSSDTTGEVLTPKEALKYDFKRITKDLWNAMKDIDIFIGHNYLDFDRKVINTAFLLAGLPPLKYKVIDTLKTAREQFRFGSNKMAYINSMLGIRNKISNEGFELWRRCAEGDAGALDEMLSYNLGDLFATEELYYKVRPYIFNHPDLSLYNTLETKQCPNCLSTDLKVEGYYPPTAKSRYESVRCNNCGALHRLNVNTLTKEKRKNLLSR